MVTRFTLILIKKFPFTIETTIERFQGARKDFEHQFGPCWTKGVMVPVSIDNPDAVWDYHYISFSYTIFFASAELAMIGSLLL